MRRWLTLLAAIVVVPAWAQSPRPQDAQGWVNWMASSAVRTNFSGVFVHQQAGRMETSRVVHLVDENGEMERVESLDGPPREIIRTNDQIRCFYPEARLIKLDRVRGKKFFPGLLSQTGDLSEGYVARLEGTDRVAGFECQVVVLEPRDAYRFGHRFCAELTSGLMLRASMLSERRDVVEQFAFTQLTLGGTLSREQFRPRADDGRRAWRTDDSALQVQTTDPSGWAVTDLPAGFRKVVETRRAMAGRPGPVVHQLYSDGLASVSVFVEPATPGAPAGSRQIQHGNRLLHVRLLPDQPFTVTAVGEVPGASLERIANSLAARPR